MDLNVIRDSIAAAFDTYLAGILAALPALVSGLVVLLIGWSLARLVRHLLTKGLEKAGADPMAERVGFAAILGRFGGLTLTRLIALLVYWALLLVFVMAAANVMGLDGVTAAVERFFGYLPTLLMAIAVFLLGLWGGEKARDMADTVLSSMGIGGGKVVASALFGIIVLFMTITALNIAGVDTSLITSNILIVVGAVLIAFSIAYGFAARNILTSILSSYYGKDRLKKGQRVRIGQDEGVIEAIDSISITLVTADRKVLIPCSVLVEQRIEILSEPEGDEADAT